MPIVIAVVIGAVALIGVSIAVVGVARAVSEEKQTEAKANAEKEARIAEAVQGTKGDIGVQEQKQKGWEQLWNTVRWLGETAGKLIL